MFSLIYQKESLESTSQIFKWILEESRVRLAFSILFLSLPTYTQTKSPFPLPWQHVFPGTSRHLLSHRSESVIYPFARPKTEREREMERVTEWVSEHKTEESEWERERDIEEAEWCLCVWLQSMRSPRQLCSSAPNCRQVRLKWQKKRANTREKDKERQLASLTASEIRHITRMTVQVAS